MIGLHCIWDIPAPEKLVVLKAIREKTRQQCQCVLVTRQTDILKVLDIAGGIDWNYIQLHAEWGPGRIIQLRKELKERGLQPALIGVVEASLSSVEKLKEIAEVTDILLIDSSICGGSGKTAATLDMDKAVSIAGSKPFIIAGGLRAENVGWWIEEYHPWGVDVQSGVEDPGGGRNKNPVLIREFVEAVRCRQRDVNQE